MEAPTAETFDLDGLCAVEFAPALPLPHVFVTGLLSLGSQKRFGWGAFISFRRKALSKSNAGIRQGEDVFILSECAEGSLCVRSQSYAPLLVGGRHCYSLLIPVLQQEQSSSHLLGNSEVRRVSHLRNEMILLLQQQYAYIRGPFHSVVVFPLRYPWYVAILNPVSPPSL